MWGVGVVNFTGMEPCLHCKLYFRVMWSRSDEMRSRARTLRFMIVNYLLADFGKWLHSKIIIARAYIHTYIDIIKIIKIKKYAFKKNI